MALEGTLKDFPLPDIIQLLSLSRKTGAVEITGSDGYGVGKLYFQGGKVVSAALEDMPPLEAAYSFFTFPGGNFYFFENELPDATTAPITISNEFLIMEGIRRADEWEKLRDRVPSLDLVLGLVADPVAGNRDINLKPDEWRVLTMINGRDTIRGIARRTGFGDFKTSRIIYHLLSAGLIEPLRMAPAPAPAAPPPAAAPPPRAVPTANGGAAAPPASWPAPSHPVIRPLTPASAGVGTANPAPPRSAPPAPAGSPPGIPGATLYTRLEAVAVDDLGPTGRLMLSDAYKRMRMQPGADLSPPLAARLCEQFERDASMLVGSGRARALAEKLRRAVAEFFGS